MTEQLRSDSSYGGNATLEALEERLLKAGKGNADRVAKDLVSSQNCLYAQIEALTWLSRTVQLSASLPPLRGWAASPDVLLRLHEHIRFTRPKVVVECGSGSSTLVIADALRQNGEGYLVSIEHSQEFGGKTRQLLEREGLLQWVDLRIVDLEPWTGSHLNDGSSEAVKWYSKVAVSGVQGVDLVFVDGPPGATCKFARYPALPALVDRLAPGAQVWMDDTIRQEEVDICKDWAERYGYEVEWYALEKGLGVLTPNVGSNSELSLSTNESFISQSVLDGIVFSEIEKHFRLFSPEVVLQFGVSSITLPLARALKDSGRGRLICVAEPSKNTEEMCLRLDSEQLQRYLSIITSSLTRWSYQSVVDVNDSHPQWFPDFVLEALPRPDFVIVDGLDFQKQSFNLYPALPSIIDQLAPGSEVWMLGADNARNSAVVDQWCSDFSVSAEPAADGRVLRVRV